MKLFWLQIDLIIIIVIAKHYHDSYLFVGITDNYNVFKWIENTFRIGKCSNLVVYAIHFK